MKKLSKILVFIVLSLFLLTASGWATPILRLSTGGDTIEISDNDSNDLNNLEGAVVYNGTLGDFLVNVTTGLTKPIIGSSDLPKLDLNSVNVSGGAGTLVISWTDTDFTLPDIYPGFLTELGGTTDGTVEVKAYLDESNNPFGEGILLSDLGPFGSGAFSGSDSVVIDPDEPFSLTIVATIIHTGAGQSTSFDASVSPVPEPATMLLVGTGLIGLAGLGRKKLLKKRNG